MAIDSRKIIAIGAGTALIGAGTIVGIAAHRKRRKKNSKRKSRNRSKGVSRRRYHKKRYPHTAGKKPDTSRKRIRFTKNGQPYVIVYRNINGTRRKMAKFISKKSAKQSRKRSGGRY